MKVLDEWKGTWEDRDMAHYKWKRNPIKHHSQLEKHKVVYLN